MTQSGIQCENCGAVVAPGVNFCGVCGQPVGQARFCEQCGARVAPGIRFCESCGSPVGGPAPAPQAAPVPQYAQPTSAPAWQAAPPPQAWTPPAAAPVADAPRPRKKRRGCLWVLLVLVLLLVALVVAAFLLGWIVYTAGNLTIFPNGVPFIATPVPVP